MRNLLLTFALIFCTVILFAQEQKVMIKTSLGTIEVVLYPNMAPITVHNFLRYADKGAYSNSSFFRVCNAENEANRKDETPRRKRSRYLNGTTFLYVTSGGE